LLQKKGYRVLDIEASQGFVIAKVQEKSGALSMLVVNNPDN